MDSPLVLAARQVDSTAAVVELATVIWLDPIQGVVLEPESETGGLIHHPAQRMVAQATIVIGAAHIAVNPAEPHLSEIDVRFGIPECRLKIFAVFIDGQRVARMTDDFARFGIVKKKLFSTQVSPERHGYAQRARGVGATAETKKEQLVAHFEVVHDKAVAICNVLVDTCAGHAPQELFTVGTYAPVIERDLFVSLVNRFDAPGEVQNIGNAPSLR